MFNQTKSDFSELAEYYRTLASRLHKDLLSTDSTANKGAAQRIQNALDIYRNKNTDELVGQIREQDLLNVIAFEQRRATWKECIESDSKTGESSQLTALAEDASEEDVLEMFRLTAVLLKAGVRYPEYLEILAEEKLSPELTALVTTLQTRLSTGISFPEAMRQFPKLFPPTVIAIIDNSESANRVAVALQSATEELQLRLNRKRTK